MTGNLLNGMKLVDKVKGFPQKPGLVTVVTKE